MSLQCKFLFDRQPTFEFQVCTVASPSIYHLNTAAAAAEELIRLYVQKGHDQTARRRFLRKTAATVLSSTCADFGYLCVSTPVPKGPVLLFLIPPQGDQASRC